MTEVTIRLRGGHLRSTFSSRANLAAGRLLEKSDLSEYCNEVMLLRKLTNATCELNSQKREIQQKFKM